MSTSSELDQAYGLLKDLRPQLTLENFHSLYRSAKSKDDYTLVGAYLEGQWAAVMGYRILFDFAHGKHVYVDDLIVGPAFRSRGVGARLLKYAEKVAGDFGCQGLRLCAGVENTAGQRFYAREGWKGRAIAFKKTCQP
ncbi:MAG: GNAT family N-acetyltransferase [Bacteriovoracia bacterium]